jgi:DNA-binding MarR family transcriptional regulator
MLEERCLLETVSDPNDGRRTLVRGAPGVGRKIRKKVDVSINQTVADALASADPDDLAQALEALEFLSLQLSPRTLKWNDDSAN